MRAFTVAVLLVALLLTAVAAQAPPAPAARGFEVTHYDAALEPDIGFQTIAGQVTMTVVVTAARQRTIDVDCGDLTIDAVTSESRDLPFTIANQRLAIELAEPAAAGRRLEITVRYHGAPRNGLVFVPDRSQIYTSFSTSHWLPSVSAPDDRATLTLAVTLPAGVTAIGSGRERARRTLPRGLVRYEWQLDAAVPAYTYGFAAAPFVDVRDPRGRYELRYLASGFTSDEVRRIFRETPAMMAFFEERAGTPYPYRSYAQALVASSPGQEMSGFAVMSEAYGRAVLSDERVVSLIAHELAHQWWGNRVTNRAWTHFWLNEGMATFMAAAFLERRFGREAYDQAIESARMRYDGVRAAGHDRPLVFPDWTRPSADDRTLVYQKGAYVLHLLRVELGDEAFWNAIRRYTQTFIGRSVTTDDFQRAIEQASGRNLSAFFGRWVR